MVVLLNLATKKPPREKRFDLEGFIILESSRKKLIKGGKGKALYIFEERSYHVVFDKPVRWDTVIKALDWVVLESGIRELTKYALMQGVKGSATLRTSNKGIKPLPKIVFKYGSKEREIRKYLETRELALSICEES